MYCAKCGKEISGQQVYCNHCGNPIANTPPPYPVPVAPAPQKSKGCGCVAVLAVVFGIGLIGALSDKSTPDTGTNESNTVVSASASVFSGDCGIEASAHMQSNSFINHPELTISIKNVSNKDIAAIEFLAVPYDVYGEEIKSFATQERLHTDDLIKKGSQKQLHYGPFLLANIKSVKLFVYSVYYADGTHWGNKDATRREILNKAKRIEATFER